MWISWRMRQWSWMWFKQGQIEVECGDGCGDGDAECGDGCGDGDAEGTRAAGYLPTTKPIALHPPNNQSKPVVSTPFLSLL